MTKLSRTKTSHGLNHFWTKLSWTKQSQTSESHASDTPPQKTHSIVIIITDTKEEFIPGFAREKLRWSTKADERKRKRAETHQFTE